jgi:hypothetical protein
MKTIPMYIESENGHDEIQVPENQIQGKIEEQVKQDKWVTIEKQDGATEILTKSDIPQEQKPQQVNDTTDDISDDTEDDEEEEEEEDNTDWTKADEKEELKAKADNLIGFFGGKQANNSTPKPTETPKTESKPMVDYAKKFEKVKSATATFKAKGG